MSVADLSSAQTLGRRLSDSEVLQGRFGLFEGDRFSSWSWASLHHDANCAASQLAQDASPGDRIGVLCTNSRAAVVAIRAVWLMGGVLVPIQLPPRSLTSATYLQAVERCLTITGTRTVVVDDALTNMMGPLGSAVSVRSVSSLVSAGSSLDTTSARAVAANDLALVQFTSGSTSEPRGVALTHRQILANVTAATERLAIAPDDKLMSWLPLYHDMGLVGMLLTSMLIGCDLGLGRPQDFVSRPRRWAEWIAACRATVTAGPEFGYAMAARSLVGTASADLASIRVAVNGGEPINAAGFRNFVTIAERHGMPVSAPAPSYGMAEVGIAAALPMPGGGLRTERVRRGELPVGGVVPAVTNGEATEAVLLGGAVRGMEIRIVDPGSGSDLGLRRFGEVQLRGTSLMSGYYGELAVRDALDADGWFPTGDLGYLVGEDLVVCGRQKEVILVAGRNLFPQDVERVVNLLPTVRSGCAVAVGIPGRAGSERLCVAVEPAESDENPAPEVASIVAAEIGIRPTVMVLPRGTLPKTSSGKLQRTRVRELALGEFG